MTDESKKFDLFEGLHALRKSAFPKHCANCGRTFDTAEQFLAETESIRDGLSGLKQSYDDDDSPIIELYRNCVCGSTLMDFFSDRRDFSERGVQRRKRFGELLEYLMGSGMERELARTELLKVLRGEKSELLQQYGPPPKA